MSSDIRCPYCDTPQEICHDDGYGYEEDVRYEQECVECEKIFDFTTIISFSYRAYCSEGNHIMVPTRINSNWEVCSRCGHLE